MTKINIGNLSVEVSVFTVDTKVYIVKYKDEILTSVVAKDGIKDVVTRSVAVEVRDGTSIEAKQLLINILQKHLMCLATPKYKTKYVGLVDKGDEKGLLEEALRIFLILVVFSYMPARRYCEENKSFLEAQKKNYAETSGLKLSEVYGYGIITYSYDDLSRSLNNNTTTKGGLTISPIYCDKHVIDDFTRVRYYTMVSEELVSRNSGKIKKNMACVHMVVELDTLTKFSISSFFSLMSTMDISLIIDEVTEYIGEE